MPEMDDARAQLRRLCDEGFDWHMDASRFDFDRSKARRSGVLVLFGHLDSVPASTVPASTVPASTVPASTEHGSLGDSVARDLDVLLQRRAATMGHHPGQISFPGGGVEEQDADVTATALREAVEETGLDPAGVEILGTLPELPLAISHNLVTPVPAWWTKPSDVAAVDHREAVEVFRMPVADLLNPENRRSVVHEVGAREFTTPAFEVGDRLVWGFTAIVLANMFDALGWSQPWDERRTVVPFGMGRVSRPGAPI